MKDILESLEKAVIRQRWAFDDRWSRIGNPFVWVDFDRMPNSSNLTGLYRILQYISMQYEEYPTPKEILQNDFDKVHADIKKRIMALTAYYFPLLKDDKYFVHNAQCQATTRTQDYCAIKTFCTDLPKNPIHLDIGPGLGSHAFYSVFHLNANYLGLEASPVSYAVQRDVFRFLANNKPEYFDPIVAEKMGSSPEDIKNELADNKKYRIRHVPSWYFEDVLDESLDLVTASWVLNEVSPAGITWLMCNSMRALRMGGYFYIRDSDKLKPNRHSISYDKVLLSMGFEHVGKLDVKNRVDMYGIPRAYRKVENKIMHFEEMFDLLYGHFAISVHEGDYMQNITDQLSKKK